MTILPISSRTDSSLGVDPRMHVTRRKSFYSRLIQFVVQIIVNPCLVIQIGEVGFVDRILSPSSRTVIILLPFPRPSLSYSYDPPYRTCRRFAASFSLSPLHITYQITFQLHRPALQRGPGETVLITLFSQSAQTRPIFRTPHSYSSASISQQSKAPSVGLLRISNNPHSVSSRAASTM